LKNERQRSRKLRDDIYRKYREAITLYRGIPQKYTRSGYKYQGWYNKTEWDSYSRTCTASGISQKVCSAKFKMEQLYIKYQEAKTEWSAAHKANQEGWNTLKGLKGSDY
jgi:hypothetical protein